MRKILLYCSIFLLAGLSLLVSHLIVEYVPRRTPANAQEAPQAVLQMAREGSSAEGSNRLLLIALPLLVVVSLIFVFKKEN
jgi:hypothetical protein